MRIVNLRTCVALLLTAVSTFVVTAIDQSAQAILAQEEFIAEPGPHGAVTVLGDSVLLGSVINSPTIGAQLSAWGWGPIRTRGVGALSTGRVKVTLEARASYWIERWRNEGWDAPNVLINLGANDSGFCDTDPQCARDTIMYLVNEIGPGHTIWWPQVTRHSYYVDQAENWNQALREIDAELDYFYTWDWPLVMAADGYRSSDNTHLDPAGYRQRSARMATEFTADMARGARVGGDAALPAATSSASEFVPMASTRAIDTRLTVSGGVPAGTDVEVDLSRIVPSGATAVAAYVSATNTAADGYLTAYDCAGGRPETSNVNYLAFQTRGAVALTPISSAAQLCVYSSAGADVLVDVQGAFVPVADDPPDGLRFNPLDTPQRLLDTRESVPAHVLTIPAPAGAEALAVNLTAVAGGAEGYLTAYPCGSEPPLSATVNHLPGDVIAGTAFVPVSKSGTICVYSLALIDVVVDLTGTFTTDGDLGFVPVAPTRTLDTRVGIGGWSPIHGQGQVFDARVAPPGARAVSGTLTIAFPFRPMFLRAWGCGIQPTTSSVNSSGFGAIANSVTTGVDANGRLCVYALSATGTVFDTTGWWVDVD